MAWFDSTVIGQPYAQGNTPQPAEAGHLNAYNKSDMVQFGCDGKSESEWGTQAEIGRLQRELASSYYWSGIFCTGYFFFVANWHPLLGMFCSHPVHPWTKRDRFAIFCLSVGMSTLPSALLASVSAHSERTDVQLLSSTIVFFCVTLPIIVWELALYWLSIGGVFCKGRCGLLLPAVAACKACCLVGSLAVAALFALTAVLIIYLSDATLYKMLLPVASGRVQSWLLWFPLWMVLPYLGFLHCWFQERRSVQLVHAPQP